MHPHHCFCCCSCIADDPAACHKLLLSWSSLQVELPEPITLCAADMRSPSVAAWLNRNLGRIRHLVLRSDEAATGMLPRLKSSATALHSLEVAQCSAMQQLPAGLGGLPHLTALVFNSWCVCVLQATKRLDWTLYADNPSAAHQCIPAIS
jgi:hypothetical protein